MLVDIWCFFSRGTDGEGTNPVSYHKTKEAAEAQVKAKGEYDFGYGVRSVPAVLLKGKYYRLVSKNAVVITS